MTGSWPPPPSWPPEVPPPWTPPEREPPRHYPPVPIVYEEVPMADALADRLLERRIVLVRGPLDLPTATEAGARLMLLDGSGDDPVELLLSCSGVDLIAAAALADTIELMGVEVRALCSGAVEGAAVLPFAVASRRLAQPHATFLLTDPDIEMQGRASDLGAEASRHADMVVELHSRVAAATGRTPDAVTADFRSRRRLSAVDADSYGLVDEIVQRHPPRKVSLS